MKERAQNLSLTLVKWCYVVHACLMVIEMLLLSPATLGEKGGKTHLARCKRTDDLLSSLGCCCVAYLRVGAEQLLIPLYLQHRQRNKECRQENKQLK